MFELALSFATAFTLSFFIIPFVIKIAHFGNLFDKPSERSSHTETISSLGGVAIFVGVMFSIILWTPAQVFPDLQYTLCASIVIFLIGVKDDLIPLSALKKLIGQLVAAAIVVFKSGIKITSLHGFMGIREMPDWFSVLLSIFTIIVIINSFNLIDGINGLSGSIAIIVAFTFGTWFYCVDKIGLAIMAYSLIGAVLAFLKYNFTPARIFMGDTGALLLGLILSILVIQFIEINEQIVGSRYAIQAGPAVAIGALILPLFDTARVFTIRLLRGRSPFTPDRLHIHHLLLDRGLSHMQATGVLATVTSLFIAMVLSLQELGAFQLLGLTLFVAWVLSARLQRSVVRYKMRLRA